MRVEESRRRRHRAIPCVPRWRRLRGAGDGGGGGGASTPHAIHSPQNVVGGGAGVTRPPAWSLPGQETNGVDDDQRWVMADATRLNPHVVWGLGCTSSPHPRRRLRCPARGGVPTLRVGGGPVASGAWVGRPLSISAALLGASPHPHSQPPPLPPRRHTHERDVANPPGPPGGATVATGGQPGEGGWGRAGGVLAGVGGPTGQT